MAVSRFYKPEKQQYISQFVPENLQLMQSALERRQKEADFNRDVVEKTYDELLGERALPFYDTEVLGQVKSETEEFVSSLQGLDYASPEASQKIKRFIKDRKVDPRLNKIRKGVELYDTAQTLMKQYGTDENAWARAPENEQEFLWAWKDYTEQAGPDKKFAYDFLLGKENIIKGVDTRANKDNYYKNVTADGRQWLAQNVYGEYFKRGVTEITPDKIANIAGLGYEDYRNSSTARQIGNRYDKAQREGRQLMDYAGNPITSKEDYILDDFLRSGLTRVFGKKTTSGQYQAANRGRQKLEDSQYALLQSGSTPGLFADYPDLKEFDNEMNNLLNSTNKDDRKKGLHMQAERDHLNTIFEREELVDEEKKVFSLSKEDVFNFPINRLEQVWEKAQIEKSGDPVSTKSALIFFKGKVNWNERSEKEKRNLIINEINENVTGEYGIESLRKVVGDIVGISYEGLKDRQDEFVSKGQIFQTTDIYTSATKQGKEAKQLTDNLLKAAANTTLFTVENKNIKNLPVDNGIPDVEEIINGLVPGSTYINFGPTGTKFMGKYKDEGGKITTVQFGFNEFGDVGKELINKLGGQYANQILMNERFKNITPISPNNEEDHTQELLSRMGIDRIDGTSYVDQIKKELNSIKLVNNSTGNGQGPYGLLVNGRVIGYGDKANLLSTLELTIQDRISKIKKAQ
jgi:hypothetical protein